MMPANIEKKGKYGDCFQTIIQIAIMNTPKVSILVPICNVEKYLTKCLDSLVTQTLQEIEIICINDGSTDNSLQIINEFASKDNRIMVIDKPNSGYGDSMNQGLEIAKGEYIGIVESDDFADCDMFEQLYSLTDHGSIDIVRSNYYLFWDDIGDADCFHAEIRNYGKIIDLIQEKEIMMVPPAIWTAIYRKNFLLENEIRFLATPGASYQDTSFFIKSFFMAKKLLFTEKKYLHYRQDNATSSVNQCALAKASFVNMEMNEADRYLKRFPERYAAIETFYNAKKLRAYFWNLYRVDDKKGYIRVMQEASREILYRDTYEKRYFSIPERIMLQCLKMNSLHAVYFLLEAKKIKQAIFG